MKCKFKFWDYKKLIFLLKLILYFSILLAIEVNSDSPPSWSEFEIRSPNKLYLAKVSKIKDNTLKKNHWQLSVLKKGKTVWSCPFNYRFGYPGGILTDDGKFFVMVEVWYYRDKPLVEIYKEGSQIPTEHLTGNSFSISESALKSTSSHFLWFDQSNYYKIDLSLNQIILTTLDKKDHKIDLNTGMKIK